MNKRSNPETIGSISARCSLYVALFVAVGFLPSLDIVANPFDRDVLFTEYSYSQFGQSIALLTGIVATVWLLRRKVLPQLGFLILALLTCALVRESDTFLDYLADGLWQAIVVLILIAVAAQLGLQRATLGPQIAWLGRHFSCGLMLAGFAIVMGFSRVFGRGVVWQQIMGTSYTKTIKYFAEESIELLGYALLTIGVVEFCVAASRRFHSHRPAIRSA